MYSFGTVSAHFVTAQFCVQSRILLGVSMAYNGAVKTRNEYDTEQLKSISDTPMTNAVASANLPPYEYMKEMTRLARDLERQLAEAVRKLKNLQSIQTRSYRREDNYMVPRPNDLNSLSDTETEQLFASFDRAKVAEQVDATDLKSAAGNSVPVRPRPLAFLRTICALVVKR